MKQFSMDKGSDHLLMQIYFSLEIDILRIDGIHSGDKLELDCVDICRSRQQSWNQYVAWLAANVNAILASRDCT